MPLLDEDDDNRVAAAVVTTDSRKCVNQIVIILSFQIGKLQNWPYCVVKNGQKITKFSAQSLKKIKK